MPAQLTYEQICNTVRKHQPSEESPCGYYVLLPFC
jgi:hypothetical protein